MKLETLGLLSVQMIISLYFEECATAPTAAPVHCCVAVCRRRPALAPADHEDDEDDEDERDAHRNADDGLRG